MNTSLDQALQIFLARHPIEHCLKRSTTGYPASYCNKGILFEYGSGTLIVYTEKNEYYLDVNNCSGRGYEFVLVDQVKPDSEVI